MSLPIGGPWPPPPQDIAFSRQAIWAAWLAGDPDGLLDAYSAVSSSNTTASDFFSREGGVVPRLARFFWGRPTSGLQRRHKLHVPLAADIATASADLLFSEPPQFRATEGSNAAATELVDEALNVGEFHAGLLEAAEIAAALGGCWLRLVWDREQLEHVMVDTVMADCAWGEWWMGHLQAVTFFTEVPGEDEKKVYRHLERHEPGWILHGLYEGEANKLGRQIPLQDNPATEPYAGDVNADGAIATGVQRLTAAYTANIRPQRRWRKIDQLAELGRSDYDGVEPLMDALDECYTSWMRDLRLAKARIIVPEFMLKDLGKGQGSWFDEEQEIFTKLNIAPLENGINQQITAQQFEIRTEQHKATADQIVQEVLRSAGYSSSTFGEQSEEGGAKTATEITARERQSNRTRDKKARYWTQALEPVLTTWLGLESIVYGRGAVGEVVCEWPESSQPDMEVLARTVETLRRAEAASTDTLVRMQHPDWDEEQITAEVDAIQAESGRDVPDLGPLPE